MKKHLPVIISGFKIYHRRLPGSAAKTCW